MKQRLFWKLYPAYLFTSVVGLLVVAIIVFLSVRSFFYEEKKRDLLEMGRLLVPQFERLVKTAKKNEIQDLCVSLGQKTVIRFTVVLPDGRVLGDSDEDPKEMENHHDRIEIQNAFKKDTPFAHTIRYSETLEEDFMYLAIPLHNANVSVSASGTIGVLRVSLPLVGINSILTGIYYKIFLGLLVFLILMTVINWPLSKRLSRPLELMKQQAESIARGDFSKKLELYSSAPREYFDLADAMNKITVQLAGRIDEILKAKNEQEAMFTSILEGIVAIDLDERIIHLNQATIKLLGLNEDWKKNSLVNEVFCNDEIKEFIRTSLRMNGPLKKDIEVYNGEKKFLVVHSSPMLDFNGDQLGVVIVINDYTKIRELESHRRDFVANVSHELRTPLTNIQGFSETLLNPAVEDISEQREFIQIINNHARRLGAIIEDLLSLASIEKETTEDGIDLNYDEITPVVESAISLCKIKAKKQNVKIICNCQDVGIKANVNAQLLEQAIANLLDNAIKYGKDGGEVKVEISSPDDKFVNVSIVDQGPGISQEHLSRLFERFYRVDKARSRKLGGTGLGLSIVKHIALAHKGNVEVESIVGRGSTFTILIPKIT